MSASELRADQPAAAVSPRVTASRALFGRRAELAALDDLLERLVGGAGGAIVLRGDPGIGKSALIAATVGRARSRGIRVLSTSGVRSEAVLPFAGLHQLLAPVLDLAPQLAPGQRDALLATFGMSATAAPPLFLVGLATLELIGDLAARGAALLVVDDAQWLDQPTGAVLGFVARRLAEESAAMVIATRHAPEGPLDTSGLTELTLRGLDDASAGALLDATFPTIDAIGRRRVLDEAAGNPLALLELPAELPGRRVLEGGALSPPLALPEKLERAFAGAAAELPSRTRALLLVASADDQGRLGDALRAAALVVGDQLTAADVTPAIAAQLVAVDGDQLGFRHPLIRSAVYQSSDLAERHAAHAALAQVLAPHPTRRVWHRAAATLGADEVVATELDAVAEDARHRGAIAVAVAAYERAAELSEDSSGRGARLVRAAEAAFALGQGTSGARLLLAADPQDLAMKDRMRLSWLRRIHQDDGWWQTSGSVLDAVARIDEDGHGDLVADFLLRAATACWWGQVDRQRGADLVSAAARLGEPGSPGVSSRVTGHVAERDAVVLAVRALADPVGQAPLVLSRIGALGTEGTGPYGLYLVGVAASAAWAYDVALPFLDAAVDGLRSQGRVGLLAQALATQAWAAVHQAREPLAVAAAEEAVQLATETDQPRCAAVARLAQATIAAERGDRDTEAAITARTEALFVPRGETSMLALVQFVRGRGAVAHQRYAEGLEHLERLFRPNDVAYHPFVGAWALSDMVEAAEHTGRRDLAATHLLQLESLAAATSGSLLQAQAAYARPLVAGHDEAEALFRAAIEGDVANWPCFRGRMLLWYGRWLRRQRRVSESRAPLRMAMQSFDALCFPTLAETARQELRASGEASDHPVHPAWSQLTPQELQIARLAAEGLSNRQIGEKLFISHRTVGYHLHRIFPKLEITSRHQLHTLLPPEAVT